MIKKLGLVLFVSTVALAGTDNAHAASPLNIYGELNCAVHDTDGEFMKLGKDGVFTTDKSTKFMFETIISISPKGYFLKGPQFPVADQRGNAQLMPKSGPVRASFSYMDGEHDMYDVSLANAEGSWDNFYQELKITINPVTGSELWCNFPSD